jgi:hypothetical protein
MSITDIKDISSAVTEEPCPTWCAGHTEDGRHLSALCAPWCIGHLPYENELDEGNAAHVSDYCEVTLSLAEPYELGGGRMYPDHFAVNVWHVPPSAPVVSLRHVDDYMPDMTPAEAMALAADLVRAAGTAAGATAAPAGGSCPPWCAYGAYGDCDPQDDSHESTSYEAPVTEHNFCSYERDLTKHGREGATRCLEGNYVALAGADGSVPEIAISHGVDALPYMTLADAQDFALNILELINTARTGSHQG